MNKRKEIEKFFANPDWCIDSSTPQYIKDHFDKTWGADAPSEPDNTLIFHGGVCVGTRQDLAEGKIDPLDRDSWK